VAALYEGAVTPGFFLSAFFSTTIKRRPAKSRFHYARQPASRMRGGRKEGKEGRRWINSVTSAEYKATGGIKDKPEGIEEKKKRNAAIENLYQPAQPSMTRDRRRAGEVSPVKQVELYVSPAELGFLPTCHSAAGRVGLRRRSRIPRRDLWIHPSRERRELTERVAARAIDADRRRIPSRYSRFLALIVIPERPSFTES